MRLLWLFFLLGAVPARAQEEGNGAASSPSLINPGGYIVYYNSEGPLSYVSEGRPPKERVELGELSAQSCQYGFSVPIIQAGNYNPMRVSGAAGDGGYQKAIGNLKRAFPQVAGLYDVKVDLKVLGVLGLFQRLCTVVTARAWR